MSVQRVRTRKISNTPLKAVGTRARAPVRSAFIKMNFHFLIKDAFFSWLRFGDEMWWRCVCVYDVCVQQDVCCGRCTLCTYTSISNNVRWEKKWNEKIKPKRKSKMTKFRCLAWTTCKTGYIHTNIFSWRQTMCNNMGTKGRKKEQGDGKIVLALTEPDCLHYYYYFVVAFNIVYTIEL